MVRVHEQYFQYLIPFFLFLALSFIPFFDFFCFFFLFLVSSDFTDVYSLSASTPPATDDRYPGAPFTLTFSVIVLLPLSAKPI